MADISGCPLYTARRHPRMVMSVSGFMPVAPAGQAMRVAIGQCAASIRAAFTGNLYISQVLFNHQFLYRNYFIMQCNFYDIHSFRQC